MKDEAKEHFMNAPGFARAFPFWAWNDRLKPEEIRRQVREMKAQGMGGFFMHSREGLETAYLGDEWDRCILAAVDEAAKNGMYAWLYDEDRWPSGTAGGQVCQGGDEYRLKGLTLQVSDVFPEYFREEEESVAAYMVRLGKMGPDGKKGKVPVETCIRLPDCEALHQSARASETFLLVRVEVSAGSGWFNGEAPPDNLNPATVERFLELTHEHYYRLVGNYFGDVIPGIFSDEPSLADNHASFPADRGWLPWTWGLETFFQERRGYDLFDYLPYLYFEGTHSRKIRHDYWRTISERFSETYSRRLGEWCGERKLLFTGHFLQEHKLGLGTRVNGSVMPHYQYQQVPGIDILRDSCKEFVTVKQCTSVANQLGKPLALSETYGCTGWDFTFQSQKRIGDWQYVLGINRRCQHLSLYSLRGGRKRDYPPSFLYQNPWWEQCHVVESYFASLGTVLERGQAVRPMLLLHPASTAWSLLGVNPYGNPLRREERDIPPLDARGKEFNRLIQLLCLHHYDMDLGDELLLDQYGAADRRGIRVGRAVYSVVVLPPMDTICESTFNLLKDYVGKGGLLLAQKPYPTMIEGVESIKLRRFWEEHASCLVEDERELLRRLDRKSLRQVRITKVPGVEDTSSLALLKKEGEDYYLFVTDYESPEARRVTVLFQGVGAVEEWNPLTKDTRIQGGIRIPGKAGLSETLDKTEVVEGKVMQWETILEPAGSRLYRIRTAGTPVFTQKDDFLPAKSPVICQVLPAHTPISLTMENTLPLDRCRYALEEGDWSEEMEIWKAQSLIRQKLGMRSIDQHGQVQRYLWCESPHPQDGHTLHLSLSFWVEVIPTDDAFLAAEAGGDFQASLNGEAVGAPEGFFLDPSFLKMKLPRLKRGENILELAGSYHSHTELENCYICGSFGIDPQRRIISKPEMLHTGDWTMQGLFHYAGAVDYRYTYYYTPDGTQRLLELCGWNGVCASIYVNGKVMDIPWPAENRQNITPWLKEGENELRVRVTGSPRNMFGPFHLSCISRAVTNNACFMVEGDEHTDHYNVVPYGLTSPPRLLLS